MVVLLAVPACTNHASSGAQPLPSVTPGATAEESALNAVLAGLDGVMGDLQRILVRERRITPEVTDRLRAIYTGPELLNQIDAFKADVAAGLTGYKSNPGNRVTTVSRVVTATSECVLAQVDRDYSPVTQGARDARASLYVILVPKRDTDDPRHLNPTPWTMLYDGVQDDGSQPDDVCR